MILFAVVAHISAFLKYKCSSTLTTSHIFCLLDPMALQENHDTIQFLPARAKTNWIIRTATIDDRTECAALIQLSYSSQLIHHYSAECLEKCLPLITTPREQLLTSNTWYLAEHPETHEIVGCGGWTVRQPQAAEVRGDDDSKVSCMDPTVLVPHLRHFASHPDFPRCGIASMIWKRIQQDIAREFGVLEGRPFPTLEVFSTLNAQPFYESCGFVVVEQLNITLAKDAVFPAILMRRHPT